MTKTLTLDGARIRDIASFYAEVNRVFMVGEDWTLGESLDALDDMLRGGYGAIEGQEPVRLVWNNMAASQAALGIAATVARLREKLQRPDLYDADRIGRQLDAVERGEGPTYFDTILHILADHPNIELVAA
ncbi:barstar family protein [Sphingomonas sp. PL-96]|uniref:barstar family protein n=1 Tax=Sphingomonas sp. PL-96 TaxID=2887201 RepID=UPI001E613D3D|nr:barstar family protein [Sphingomonas sp. PL-96]MCC2975424.1 barstar family protein [Sphingomonas sp. PL-96]